jgi:hypothetical protein
MRATAAANISHPSSSIADANASSFFAASTVKAIS